MSECLYCAATPKSHDAKALRVAPNPNSSHRNAIEDKGFLINQDSEDTRAARAARAWGGMFRPCAAPRNHSSALHSH